MFNSEKEISNQNNIETLLGENCTIEGALIGSGKIKIDGHIKGDITWNDNLEIGSCCECKGNISCTNADVYGIVNGGITCREALTIENSGKVFGDISVKNLVIKDGGLFQGKCLMSTKEYSENE